MWRVTLRKSPVNRVLDPFEKLPIKDNFLGWILLRVADVERFTLANRWMPSEGERNRITHLLLHLLLHVFCGFK